MDCRSGIQTIKRQVHADITHKVSYGAKYINKKGS
jgi:hypothetical protein